MVERQGTPGFEPPPSRWSQSTNIGNRLGDRLIISQTQSCHNTMTAYTTFIPPGVLLVLYDKEKLFFFFTLLTTSDWFVVRGPLTSLGAKVRLAYCVHLWLWPDIKCIMSLLLLEYWLCHVTLRSLEGSPVEVADFGLCFCLENQCFCDESSDLVCLTWSGMSWRVWTGRWTNGIFFF